MNRNNFILLLSKYKLAGSECGWLMYLNIFCYFNTPSLYLASPK